MLNLNDFLNVAVIENTGLTIKELKSIYTNLESELFDIDLYFNPVNEVLTVNVYDRSPDIHTNFFKEVIGQLINNHKAGKNFKVIELNSATKLGNRAVMLYNFTSVLS